MRTKEQIEKDIIEVLESLKKLQAGLLFLKLELALLESTKEEKRILKKFYEKN